MRRGVILSIHLALFFSLFLSIGSAEAAAEKVTLQFENGVSYYGEVKNGKPHGKGTMWWGTNKSYSGSWVNGKRSGYGKYVFRDESESDLDETSGQKDNVKTIVYTGYWSNDQQNGTGIYKSHVKAIGVGNQQDLVQKGSFKNNVFVKGYEGYSVGNVLFEARYKDDDTSIALRAHVQDTRDVIQIMRSKAFDYYGYSKLKSIYNFNGYHVYKDEDDHLIKEIVNSGKVVETQYIDQDGEIQSGRNMNDLIKQIEPYVKGLNEVFKMI